ncbi:hypothetical protein IA539_01025 [Gordonia sp. zg691]|uniref:hypothetical protein n=1 Tax=Gordonia jinghuaiqii TaxID=2758710 RepID=UPI0016623133|nr:hypothetical protein [Gordonia jinghuaiqii]MBD0859800.1 hypothetical protein [Gordonia jinghuaiqii]
MASREWSALYVDANVTATELFEAGLGMRALPFVPVSWSSFIADHAGANLVVVCAPEPIEELVADVLDVPRDGIPALVSGSVTRVRASGSGVRSMLCLNDTLHLIAAGSPAVDIPERKGVRLP